MKNISAGWRMAYISRSKADSADCIFCARPRGRSARKNFVVLEGEHAFIMMNRYPYTTGHLMVAPYRHVAGLARLRPDEALEITRLVAMSEAILREAVRPDGLNVGVNIGQCAGAGYPGHVHVHVVPRWDGDTNFMPVVSEAKVLPETLSDTYRKLRKVVARMLRRRTGAGRGGRIPWYLAGEWER
jgi:ATP adenylyltransferase